MIKYVSRKIRGIVKAFIDGEQKHMYNFLYPKRLLELWGLFIFRKAPKKRESVKIQFYFVINE